MRGVGRSFEIVGHARSAVSPHFRSGSPTAPLHDDLELSIHKNHLGKRGVEFCHWKFWEWNRTELAPRRRAESRVHW